MDSSRTNNVKRNILWGNISNILLSIISIICRTIFIYRIGVAYLGVSGLFTNVLGLLSFSELGIGTAISFALYKPIAEGNDDLTKSLLILFKKAYRVIAVIVTTLGFLIFPFLHYLVKTDIPMSEIQLFYFIFLFNTVSSYFVSYKTSYVTAIQKNYIITNINTITQIATSILQIAAMYVVPTYLIFIIIQAIIGLISKVGTVLYINYRFPLVTEKNIQPVEKGIKRDIWKNVRALIIHKIGDISVHQTDNIIISVFVDTLSVGLVSNYTAINAIVSKFTTTFFDSFTASFGNLIAKGNRQKQKEIFELYDFVGFWVYGFVCVSFITLSKPFITIWIGKEMLLDDLTMCLYFTSLYLAGMSYTVYNFKVAAGKFNEDKWVAIIQAVVNLVVSIVMVKQIGLPGVYVGTIVQRLIVNVIRPYIVYKYVLGTNSIKYYLRFVFRGALVAGICILMRIICNSIITEDIRISSFILLLVLTMIIPNIVISLVYYPTGIIKRIINIVFRRSN